MGNVLKVSQIIPYPLYLPGFTVYACIWHRQRCGGPQVPSLVVFFLAYLFSAAVHLAAGEREGHCIRAAWSAVVEDDTGSIW